MRLSRIAVGDWITEVTSAPPPPVLRIDRERTTPLEDLPGFAVVLSLQTDLDPGCFRFVVDPVTAGLEKADEPVQLREAAHQISEMLSGDERTLFVSTEHSSGGGDDVIPRSTGVRASSSIMLRDQRRVPVVGPGGQVTLHARLGQIFGRSAVRPIRGTARPASESRWHRPDTVLTALVPYFDQGLEVFPDFGYFEGSWLDVQMAMRPAFSFTLENSPTAQWPYRREMLFPATFETQPVEGDLLGEIPGS